MSVIQGCRQCPGLHGLHGRSPCSQLTTYPLGGGASEPGGREHSEEWQRLLSKPPLLPAVQGATGISPWFDSWCLLSLRCIHSFQIFYFLSICSQGKACWGGNITHELQEHDGCWGAEEAVSVVAVLWFPSFLQARSDLTLRPAGLMETFITSSLNRRC